MSAGAAALCGLIWLIVLVTAAWAWQRRSGNAAIIDGVWALGVGSIGLLYASVGPAPIITRGLIGVFAVIWSVRLGVYLLVRNAGTHEERRYAELRQKWNQKAQFNLLILFIFQAFMAWVIGLTFLALCWRSGAPHPGLILLALLLFMLSVGGETAADLQLAQFQRDPNNANRVCDRGLWAWSRHPNYFFEALHWWTYPILAVGSSMVWPALIAPVTVGLLLLYLSGIPTVENGIDERRPGYANYRSNTSAFFPRPPRSGSNR